MKFTSILLISFVLISSLKTTQSKRNHRTGEKSFQVTSFPLNKEIYIYTTNQEFVFDIKGESISNGAILMINYFYNLKSQRFIIQNSPVNDYYYIQCVKSGKFLAVENEFSDNGAKIVQLEKKSSRIDNQIFKIEHVRDGFYSIIPKHSGKALEIQGDRIISGQYLVQSGNFLKTATQIFKFVEN